MPFDQYKVEGDGALGALNHKVQQCNQRFFEFAWSSRACAEEVEQIIRWRYPSIVQQARFFNSGAVLFGQEGEAVSPLRRHVETYDGYRGSMESFDAEVEFGSILDTGAVGWYAEFDPERVVLECSIDGKLSADASAVLVLQHERDGEQIGWYGAEFREYIREDDAWGRVFLARRLLDVEPDDRFKIYVWNKGKLPIATDNLLVELHQR